MVDRSPPQKRGPERSRAFPLNTSPLHLLHRATQRAGELFQEKMTAHEIDITARQYAVLTAIAGKDGSIAQDIVAKTNIDRSTVSNVLLVLKRKRFIQIRRSPADARAKMLILTSAGREILEAAAPLAAEVDAAFTASLKPMHAKSLLGILSTLTAEAA